MKHPSNEAHEPDWLDDPVAAPSADQARLERALAPLRYDAARKPLQLDTPSRDAHDSPSRWRSWRRRGLRLGVAAALALAAWFWWRGAPRVDIGEPAKPLPPLAQLPSSAPFELVETTGGAGYVPGLGGSAPDGGRIVCGADASARVRVGAIGSFELEQHSALRLERGGEDGYQVFLERGALNATIFAAPRLFTVGTPAGLAVDLGCIYRTEVEPDGVTRLSVRAGRVSFESDGVHALVPAGAECRASPGRGPSVPVWTDAPPALRDAASRFDALAPGPQRLELLRASAAASTRRDTLTLIHLLERAVPTERELLVDAIETLAARPAELERARLVAGEREALAQWRERLAVDW
jgi:hypothetical protein